MPIFAVRALWTATYLFIYLFYAFPNNLQKPNLLILILFFFLLLLLLVLPDLLVDVGREPVDELVGGARKNVLNIHV